MMDSIKDRTHSIWELVDLPGFGAVTENLQTDVCVVGGGMSGVSIAYQLAKRGHKVVLLEAFQIGSGQSGRTTAHLSYQLEEQFSMLEKHHEMEKISLFAHGHRRAIDVIEENMLAENISCDFTRVDGYLFAGPHDGEKLLRREVEIGEKCGLGLKYLEEIPGHPQLGSAVMFPRQAQFHPLKYMAGLLRAMKGMDVKIFEHSPAAGFDVKEDAATVTTSEGYSIQSKWLVVATDTPVNNRFYIHTKQSAYRTYVVGMKIPDEVNVPLLWDTADPYHYVRRTGSTLIIGGEDHRTGQEPEHDPFLSLKDWAREKFPYVGEVEWQWSGQVFEPADQLAFIGKNPGLEKNVFIVTGASGSGMTNATLASLIIPDIIEGRSNPWIKLLDPGRSMVKSPVEFIKENVNTAVQYKDWLTASEVTDLSQIPDDSGRLMREGMTKSCIYHSQGECFEKKSAVCKHLGGIVHWNDFEKTWDCPAHGSRYNAYGKVIEGPALGDLQET